MNRDDAEAVAFAAGFALFAFGVWLLVECVRPAKRWFL